MAGKASAEFRSRYPVPLRGTAGSFIILDQLRDGNWVKNIFPKIAGRSLLLQRGERSALPTEIIKYDENLAVVRAVTTAAKDRSRDLELQGLRRLFNRK